MAENKDNPKAQSKETGTMNVHLFNCDRTYNLQAIRALLEDVEKESRWQFAVQEHYFPLPQMAETCAEISELEMDFAVFVVHANESRLSLNEERAGIGYAKIYRALLQATNDRVLIVIGGDDNYKGEEISQVLSRWAKMKISSQFSNEYLDGRKSFIFSWKKKHRHIHKEALLHFLDDTKRGEVFVPKPRPLPTDLEQKKSVKGLGDAQTPKGRASLTQTTPSLQTIPQKPYLAGAETDKKFKYDPLQGNVTYPTDQKQQKPQSFSNQSTVETFKARSKGEGCLEGQRFTEQEHTSKIPFTKAPLATTTTTATHHVSAQLQSHTSPATESFHSKNLQHRSGHSAATREIHQVPLGENEKRKEEAQLTPVNVAIIECGVSEKSVDVARCFFYKVAQQLRLKPHLVPIQGTSPRQLAQKLIKYANSHSFGYIVLLVDKTKLTKIATKKEEISSYKHLLEEIQVNAETQAILIVCNDTDLIQGQLISESVANFLRQHSGTEFNEDIWITLSWNEKDPRFSTVEYELYLANLVQIADARRETASPLRTTNQASAQNHHSETRKQQGIVQGSLHPSQSGSHVGYGMGEFPPMMAQANTQNHHSETRQQPGIIQGSLHPSQSGSHVGYGTGGVPPMMANNTAQASSSYSAVYKGKLLLWEGTLENGVPKTSYKHPGWEPPQSLCERLRKDNKDKSSAEFTVKENADGSHDISVDSKVWGALKAAFKRAPSTDDSSETYCHYC